ncbi:MAG: hypothetical protein C7B44_09960 [Sulfobacillus thermosulfidooxidans]|uniref:Pentapeptide repeat-containing protein n=1 Tax=Sulfobacillus thermotolerans TaxID=338644 RepID=A0ABM6RVX1_9FIRM|nr:hypothetical protein BXT84_05435 [Sulfobacillus thermotolerans]POB10992.1 hypothetical protein CO251_07695 [Sulfobacillus sp. hq2]PSR36268.1 MAG: hypothetical protein C7B44_09960 [Sulfobacillus thermosulfidooxidans]
MRLDSEQLEVHGRHINSVIDISHITMERGTELGVYVKRLNETIAQSKFHMRYGLLVHNVSPPVLRADLSLIHFRECNFEATDFSGSIISGPLSVERCIIDGQLPPLSIGGNELFRYPPGKAARELGITDVKDVLVLRWGLTQDARHVGQAFLWLERRYPKTEEVLARVLRGLPSRRPRYVHWTP